MTPTAASTFVPLVALSPLDGRYENKVSALRAHFSEYGLIRNRVRVEVEWLKALAAEGQLAEIAPFSATTLAELDAVVRDFAVAEREVEALKAVAAELSAGAARVTLGEARYVDLA